MRIDPVIGIFPDAWIPGALQNDESGPDDLPRASSAMMCSRELNAALPKATMPSLRIASRITANDSWSASPSGMM